MKSHLSLRVAIASVCLLLVTQSLATAGIPFIIDPTGTATGLSAIAPTSGNQGKYNAGSWLTLSGSASGTFGGVPISGNFANQKVLSGAFSTGNPGSLTSFLGGAIDVDIDDLDHPTRVIFTGQGNLSFSRYDATYAQQTTSIVPLSPQIGGGTIATPGSAPASYGVSLTTKAPVSITASTGTLAIRNVDANIHQISGGSMPLSGSGGTFTFSTAGMLGLTFSSGDLDYNLKGGVLPVFGVTIPDFVGSTSLVSAATQIASGVGTLTSNQLNSNLYLVTVTFPVQTTVTETLPSSDSPLSLSMTYGGSVAGYAYVIVPEPGTIALAAIGLLALAPTSARRWRRMRSG